MPPGTVDVVLGLALAVLMLVLLLGPAYQAGQDVSGAVDVTATRDAAGVTVRLERFPRTRSVEVLSVGVSRELADELGLEVPDGYRVRVDRRWLSAERRVPLAEPVELLFPATKKAARPVTGVLRVVSRYRPRIRRIRHYIQVNVDVAPGEGPGDAPGPSVPPTPLL